MLNIQADLLLYGPTTEAIRSQGSRGMNDAASVTQIAYKCIFLHMLEHWLGQKPGSMHRTVIARREKIQLREGPF